MKDLTKNIVQLVVGGGVLFAAVAWLSGGCGERIGHQLGRELDDFAVQIDAGAGIGQDP